MKYNLDLDGAPNRAPRIAITSKGEVRTNLALLAKLAKSKTTDVSELREIETLVGNALRALNEI